ncbi:hypothetical protein Tco_0617245 [Tanacetum coccineum]
MKKGDSWKERGAKERKDVVWREDYERRGEKRRGGEEEVRLGRDLTLLERNSKRERREKRREIGKRGMRKRMEEKEREKIRVLRDGARRRERGDKRENDEEEMREEG